MNLIDLEMYKWKFFHDVFVPSRIKFHPKTYNHSGWDLYWCEHGAFVSVMPRQTGKTEMISRLINYFVEKEEYYLVVVHSMSALNVLTKYKHFNSNKIIVSYDANKLKGGNFASTNLLADEFLWFNSANTKTILSYPWKTVTMLSTLK